MATCFPELCCAFRRDTTPIVIAYMGRRLRELLLAFARDDSQNTQHFVELDAPQEMTISASSAAMARNGTIDLPFDYRTDRNWPGYRSNGVISHRQAISLLPYKSALNQRIAQTVGLFSVHEPIELRGPYSWVRPDQRKR
jgi:hypothetical protein